MTTVVIADDEALFRSGLAMVVAAQPDLEVVGEAGTGREAIEVVRRARPDVLLMDVQMPTMNGIEATAELARLRLPTKVLILTTFGHDEYVYDALRAGASGFLLKTTEPAHLADAVRRVADGDALLSPQITRRLIETYMDQPRPGVDATRLSVLTERERDVLEQVGHGLTNGEVAAALFLSEATVKTHLGRVLAKLGLRDRVHAVVTAYETGLVRVGRPKG